jgi:hypothetical protein
MLGAEARVAAHAPGRGLADGRCQGNLLKTKYVMVAFGHERTGADPIDFEDPAALGSMCSHLNAAGFSLKTQ